MFRRRTPLIHIYETMNGAYYLENIMNTSTLPMGYELGVQVIFMEDNTRQYRTRDVQEVLGNHNIEMTDT